jgi:hypothetical protein
MHQQQAPQESRRDVMIIACHSTSLTNFLYESGGIASKKALAMTPAMHLDGTLHVVIAGTSDLFRVNSAKQSFTRKERYPLKRDYE